MIIDMTTFMNKYMTSFHQSQNIVKNCCRGRIEIFEENLELSWRFVHHVIKRILDQEKKFRF